MSSPGPVGAGYDEDVPMEGPDDEGDGDVIRPHGQSDDSSEEEEDDPDEELRIKKDFIVDEEDDEEEDTGEAERARKRRRKRRREESEELDEDDLELITESTGRKRKPRLTRLKKRSESPRAGAAAAARRVVDSDDDLDDQDAAPPQDIHNIWDDDERRDEDKDSDADMDDFIEYEDEGAAAGPSSAQERRKAKQLRDDERRRTRATHPAGLGIDANAWQEMHDVFGDGRDYEEHFVAEGIAEEDEHSHRTRDDMRLQDVFEPSELKAKMMTEDDEIIRMEDVPERMQLATSAFSANATLLALAELTEADLDDAALWITVRISDAKNALFFHPGGRHEELKSELVMAVTFALKHMFLEHLEVPHIWHHKRDHLLHYNFDDRSHVPLLDLTDLWKIYALGQKYRSLVDRRRSVEAAYARLAPDDRYFEDEILPLLDTVEAIADTAEWLAIMYAHKKPDDTFRFHDDDDADAPKKHKTPSRISVYEVTKKSIVSRLADGFGIKPHEVVLNYVASGQTYLIDNQELNPASYAERFADADPTKALPAEELLRQARMLIATELGKDPILRKDVRKAYQQNAVVTILPTDRGKLKIDTLNKFYNFKYLHQKPITQMLDNAQFLRILDAERDHLVTVSIFLPKDAYSDIERRLADAFTSDSFDESAKAWNEERALIVKEVMEQHLVPMGSKWVREYLREEVEDLIAQSCATALRKRADVAPYQSTNMAFGETGAVMALSWGNGDPQRDDICIACVDEGGRLRESTKIANLYDQSTKDELFDLLRRRRPDVIVVGGFSMATAKLSARLKELLRAGPNPDPEKPDAISTQYEIPVIYARDDVARMFQHSKRALKEFGTLTEVMRYCIGMARYTQNPLIEYAALGPDITAVSFLKDDQHLVPSEKLLIALERVLVDVTNTVGVDLNRAMTDEHYKHLLPLVCGLGPRKAEALLQKLDSKGGHLANRAQLLKSGLLTRDVFLNAAGFLRIDPNDVSTSTKDEREDENMPDPLDSTRIHPADYELARKMATDALEYDEEDIHDEHPSQSVTELMGRGDKAQKLAELNLDEFAVSLYQVNREVKRHALNILTAELLHPFKEERQPWTPMSPWDVLTMLSGETENTLKLGLIISVYVTRVKENATVRLSSGIDGLVLQTFMNDPGDDPPKVGTYAQGVILDVKLDLEADTFLVELSTRRSVISEDDVEFRSVLKDGHWDTAQNEKDLDIIARKKRAETASNRRIIKHPNFHNFNTAQAEAYLEKQQRGDVVIRPSSKGNNHLAVTWKVDVRLYQHIDVTDSNPDPSGQALGGQLVVDAQHIYSDLDELIVNHVQAMVRRVEDLMNHERFKAKSEDELHQFLKQQLAANPTKSMYGFTLNRKRPGHFTLCFLANKQAVVQSWPVRVTPEAYYLFEAAAAGVGELCDAFKVRHLHQQQQSANAVAGGRTPFGAGMRTPARPTGGMTPGYASVRKAGATPNPYGAPPPPPGPPRGMPPPAPPQSAYGYQAPSSFAAPTPGLPAGMNPQRAAMLQDAGNGGSAWGR